MIATLALILAGLVLDVAALPPGPVPLLILLADVPFLLLIGGRITKRWRLVAGVYGLLHFAVALRWLGQVHPVQVAGAGVALSFVYVLAAIAIRAFVRRGLPYLLVVPTVLVFEEMLRTIWLGGMPWPSRALSFAAWPSPLDAHFVASSAFLGAYALVFAAALASAALARLVPRVSLAFLEDAPSGRRVFGIAVAALLLALLGVLGSRRNAPLADGPEVVAVQASIPQSLKHSESAGANMEVFQRHLDLTAQALDDAAAAERRVDAVVWPETMIPWPFVSTELAHRFPDEWENLLRIVQNVAEVAARGDGDTRYLLGGIYLFRRGDELHERVYRYGTHDSLFLLDPARVPAAADAPPPPPPRREEPSFFLARHDKHVLVPGGEYTPLGDVFPLLRRFRDFVSVIPPLEPGAEDQTPFPLTADEDGLRAGTIICFELLFPSRCRAWRRRGATVLVNAANYGWFGPTGFRAQLRAGAALRAAETGAWLVVAGNTGPTVFYDPIGRVRGVFTDRDGTVTEPAGGDATTFRGGYARYRLDRAPVDTPYTALGDAPWWALGGALALVWVLRALRRRRPGEGYGGATA